MILKTYSWESLNGMPIYLHVILLDYRDMEGYDENMYGFTVRIAQLPPYKDINNFHCYINFEQDKIQVMPKLGYGNLDFSDMKFGLVSYLGTFIPMGSQAVDFNIVFRAEPGIKSAFNIILEGVLDEEFKISVNFPFEL